ncbi:MAG: tetratricopeptide repeat protein [Gammaproteobacteria bacterium]|nr:tetratricopeptide repeat protein [Gammaproteobacteria bacterium]
MYRIFRVLLITTLMVPLLVAFEATVSTQEAFAQGDDKPKPSSKKRVRVESILQKNVKIFEKINEAFDAENIAEANNLLAKLSADPTLNNIEKAYVANYKGNICFSQDDLNCALREFKKIMGLQEGVPEAFYNQIMYVIAQVYFSQENYQEALNYAQRWFKLQAEPTADGYMLVGQAYYMLKNYDAALPMVQQGIQKYIDLGSIPKEGWLNLLSSIYRQKEDFKKMLPVLKQLVLHYPKKTYLLTIGGVYNELEDPQRMTAIYQSMFDQGLLTSESELVTLASLQLSQDNPYKAAMVVEHGLNNGSIKKELKNYRIYAQALYAAREYEKALPPMAQAAKMAKDGNLYNQLAQSYIALNRWKEADAALSNALKKGKLTNTGQTLISQGLVRFELKRYDSAKAAFNRALKIDSVSGTAANWIKYVNSEVFRIKELEKEIVINTDVEV